MLEHAYIQHVFKDQRNKNTDIKNVSRKSLLLPYQNYK